MKKLISIAVLAALGAVSQAQASVTVSINPDAGGVDPTLTVGALDWTVGNALSVAKTGETVATPGNYIGQVFTTYAMASLATFNDGAGTPIGGINLHGVNPVNAYEWTFVAGFQETFTAVAGTAGAGSSSFFLNGGAYNSSTNFFHIYADTTLNANNLTGKGFNDGTLLPILTGHFASGSGGFVASEAHPGSGDGVPVVGPLDQFGSNDYPGLLTVIGNGSTQGIIVVDSYDPLYFVSAPKNLTLDFTSQQKLAFGQTDPAACFWTGTSYMNGAGGVDCAGTGNTVGTIGGLNGSTGPNVILQADASNNFGINVIPEPGSLALLGLGFAAFGALRRKSIA